MVSLRGSLAVVAFAVVGLGSGWTHAGPDAAVGDGDRYAQKVATSVRSHHGEVKACYAVALERNPQLAGKFEAVWTIDAAGKPHSVHFPTPPADADFTACMVRTIAAWRFEKPTEPSEVTFPFVFHTPSAAAQDPGAPAAAPPAPPAAPPPAADQRPQQGSGKTSAAQRKRAPGATPTAPETRKRPKP
jgi:hypothetical protein